MFILIYSITISPVVPLQVYFIWTTNSRGLVFKKTLHCRYSHIWFCFFSFYTCVEHVIDLWSTRSYLGVNIRYKSCVFGDNKYFLDSAIHLHNKLHKHHTKLSFHILWKAIAYKMVNFYHFSGGFNIDGILSIVVNVVIFGYFFRN